MRERGRRNVTAVLPNDPMRTTSSSSASLAVGLLQTFFYLVYRAVDQSRAVSIRFSVQVKGFCGAQVFSDRAAGTVQSLTLWQSWGDLETAVGDSRYAKVTLP